MPNVPTSDTWKIRSEPYAAEWEYTLSSFRNVILATNYPMLTNLLILAYADHLEHLNDD